MKARCPTCEKLIDPTHAPVARIVGARIVTFCSQACASGRPEPRPPTEPEVSEPRPEPRPRAAPPAPTPESPTPVLAPAVDEPIPSLRRSSPRRVVIAISAVVILGGVGIAAFDGWKRLRAGKTAAEPATAPAPETPEPVTPDGRAAEATAPVTRPAAPAPAALREAAIEQLESLRRSPSQRIARLATMALAQTREPEAIEGLVAHLGTEPSELNRVAIAFALARAGDKRGLDTLVAALSASRRDVRADAAIALTRLGDRRGDKVLRSLLAIRDHKIAAAGHLARSGDDKARQMLEKIYRDEDADREARMRAAVALGAAGVDEVAGFLEETLSDGRYRVGAAASLAALGEESAREPLTRQLELNAMRVQAAEALATLGGEVDLAPLAVALTHDDEVTRVTAAEAILILTRPEAD